MIEFKFNLNLFIFSERKCLSKPALCNGYPYDSLYKQLFDISHKFFCSTTALLYNLCTVGSVQLSIIYSY